MLRARQTGLFSRFKYDILDANSKEIGAVIWPDVANAKNDRIEIFLSKSSTYQPKIVLYERSCLVEFEYLSRAWFNDIRFMLKDGDVTLASADVIQKKWARPLIQMMSPFKGALIRRSSIFTTRYDVVTESGDRMGSLFEKAPFTLKREIVIDLPDSIEKSVQCWLFFLMMNHAFR